MPFRSVNATAELQQQDNHEFPGPINEAWIVIWMNDVLIFGHAVQEHLHHSKNTLQLLREKQRYVKAQRRSYLVQTVCFLGISAFAG